MKTIIPNTWKALALTAGLALAVAASLPGALAADKPMKGGQHQLMLSGIDTEAQAQALKAGDSIAMACAKCKSVIVERVTVEKGHVQTLGAMEKHLCPGCGGSIEAVGHGKAKTDVVKHTCSKCGDDSAFCCGPKAGMDKK
ncbi:MAG: hypothetical protein HY301_04365 [Verrucomicrobia bacterium]|nr:hypothetical protein [Verrucomicrobiota bacterium]